MNRCLASLLLFSASSLPLFGLPSQVATNANPAPSGWVYGRHEGGPSWKRLTKLSSKDDLILDNTVVDEADPKTIYAAAWVVDHPDGGLFISHDAGKTWIKVPAMDGQSIRALAQSASNPKVLVVGTLKGVFR